MQTSLPPLPRCRRWLPLAVALAALLLATLGPSPLGLRLRPLIWLIGPLVALAAAQAARALRPGRRDPRCRPDLRAPALVLLLTLVALSLSLRTAIRLRAVTSRLQRADPALRTRLGQHIIAGFHDWDQARALATLGVGGVFITQRNVRGRSFAQIQAELGALQRLREGRGLPPLLVAADQEGQPVSRLSPPLTALPPLSSVVSDDEAQTDQRVRDYAHVHGRELARLGVHINLSPVADLQPAAPDTTTLDLHTRIEQRAIAADPQRVARVALVYAQTLREHGVWATAKHFPGLGRVRRDTHYLPGRLDAPLPLLRATDWLPFQTLAQRGAALIMLGHVKVAAVDPAHLATTSAALIQGVVRRGWGFDGALITDDLCMAPAYYQPGGIGQTAVAALRAGVDLLLVSYDPAQVPVVLDALLAAHTPNDSPADPSSNSASARRLRALAPPRPASIR